MGLKVSASEAAYLVTRHERIVRGRIARGELPATKERNAWRIDVDDLERIPGWRVDRGRLAQLAERDARSVESLSARLAAVERDLRDVRARLRALETADPRPSRSEGQEGLSGREDDAPHALYPSRDTCGHAGAPAAAYSLTYAAPTLPGTFRTRADACRFLARHGVNEHTPKTWQGWPPAGVALEPRPILADAISRYDPANWRITWRLRQCGDPACVCAELLPLAAE